MIFNLNTCKSYSKECSRYYRTDECCTVSADNHCDCCVCRIYAKLVSDTDQNRQQSEEVRICTEQKCQRYRQYSDDQWQEMSYSSVSGDLTME